MYVNNPLRMVIEMSREVTDERWEIIIDKTNRLLERVETSEEIDADRIENITMLIQGFANMGYIHSENRERYYNGIKLLLKDLDITFRRSSLPYAVDVTLDEIRHIAELTHREFWVAAEVFNLPILRNARSAKHLGWYYTDADDYANAMGKLSVAKFRKLFLEGQWDGTLDGLGNIVMLDANMQQTEQEEL